MVLPLLQGCYSFCACSAGKPPSAFPQDRLHIDFSQEVSIGRQLATVVDGLLEPLVEDRLSAAEALEMLTQQDQQSQSIPVQSDRYQYKHAWF